MKAIDELSQCFSKLPGIGPKSATRLVNQIIKMDKTFVKDFAQKLDTIQDKIKHCKVCGALCESEMCTICSNPTRDHETVCVVERTEDVDVMKNIPGFNGVFHVLGGVIDPTQGVSATSLNTLSLIERVKSGNVKEIVFATSPTFEGDATALYIQNTIQELLKSNGGEVKMTKLATGIPVGSSLEYLDKLTLQKSFSGRSGF